jgi:DNA-binding NtrC family response regulator
MGQFTVLIIDDEKTLARSIKLFFLEQGYEAEVAEDGEAALKLLPEMRPDLVFLDVRLPKVSGIEILKQIREFDPHIYVVMMTAYGSIEGAVKAMKLGAFDYLKKPVDLDELKILLERAQADLRLRQELSYYREREARTFSTESLIGKCEAMRRVFQQIEQITSLEEAPIVLITGETGTGKGMVARTIHVNSPRASGPYIEVDCTALSPTLVESELFGHEKGAFTDARESKMGLCEAAEGGTLFLDEVGDLALPLQGKLLRTIEERKIRRIGSVKDRTVDVRIIAATNKDLDAEVAHGTFRKELFYRLAVLTIHLPPLRERGEDILLLARYYAEKLSAKYGKPCSKISEAAAVALSQYDWPGNVREQRHVMERAVIGSTGEAIQLKDLSISASPARKVVPLGDDADVAAQFPAEGMSLPQWEKILIEKTLRSTGGNTTQASRVLGITRDTLRSRMRKYKIRKPS